MKVSWLDRVARLLGLRHPARALGSRPAWFDAAYLSTPEPAAPEPQPEPPAMSQLAATRAFDERERALVWQRARRIIGWDPDDWRVDYRGRPMYRHHYADPVSSFGWDIGLVEADGGEDLANLHPVLCHQPERFSGRFERALDMG